MIIKEKERYLCDCCQKEVESLQCLQQIKIPVPYIQEKTITTTIGCFCVCEECQEKIKNKLQEVAKFENVLYGGNYVNGVKVD